MASERLGGVGPTSYMSAEAAPCAALAAVAEEADGLRPSSPVPAVGFAHVPRRGGRGPAGPDPEGGGRHVAESFLAAARRELPSSGRRQFPGGPPGAG